jgi:hypothetical protein
MTASRLPVLASKDKALGKYGMDPQWQRVWLATQEADWRSLAILPSDPSLSIWEVAQALLDVGWQHRGTPIAIADLRNVSLAYIDPLLAEIRRRTAEGETVLVALSSIDQSPAALHIARAADRALLCVRLGSSRLGLAERTVEQVGKDRFLGTLVVRRAEDHPLAAEI